MVMKNGYRFQFSQQDNKYNNGNDASNDGGNGGALASGFSAEQMEGLKAMMSVMSGGAGEAGPSTDTRSSPQANRLQLGYTSTLWPTGIEEPEPAPKRQRSLQPDGNGGFVTANKAVKSFLSQLAEQ